MKDVVNIEIINMLVLIIYFNQLHPDPFLESQKTEELDLSMCPLTFFEPYFTFPIKGQPG